ncbi:MAG: hypothetical protein NZ519_07925 [Bacteroidia bacterium]|nr:hypothetical protein [Bacteroidia bacterium]MDW8300976.1 hypothetical protein [Bacteroidia bacterium]
MKGTQILLALLLLASITYASVTLKYFTAIPSGTEIKLQWEVQSEYGITEFQVWKRIGSGSAAKIYSVTPNGSRVYSYTDLNVMKTDETSQTYIYTLRIMQGSSYTDFTQSVTHNPTTIQRTWGSIKAMFK